MALIKSSQGIEVSSNRPFQVHVDLASATGFDDNTQSAGFQGSAIVIARKYTSHAGSRISYCPRPWFLCGRPEPLES